MTRKVERFIERADYVLSPAPGTALRASDFSIFTAIDGQNLQMEFSWNGYFGYYSMRIVRSDSRLIRAWYPRLGEPLIVRNFNEGTFAASDARITIKDDRGLFDEEMEPRQIDRAQIGVNQHIHVAVGRVAQLEEA